jgi:hypothetical protein
METVKLKLSEILSLKSEIYGMQNNSTGEVLSKGLLKQELPYYVKYRLHNLGNVVTEQDTLINKIREELIVKYGEIDVNGSTSISISIEDGFDVAEDGTQKPKYVVNPKFLEFQSEFDKVLNEEKDIEYKPFKLSDLEKMITDEFYPVLNKLIEKE